VASIGQSFSSSDCLIIAPIPSVFAVRKAEGSSMNTPRELWFCNDPYSNKGFTLGINLVNHHHNHHHHHHHHHHHRRGLKLLRPTFCGMFLVFSTLPYSSFKFIFLTFFPQVLAVSLNTAIIVLISAISNSSLTF